MLEKATETAYRSFFFYVLGMYKNQKYLHYPHLFSSLFFIATKFQS